MKKQIDKKEFSYRIVFYSMLGMLISALITWWIEFIKYFPVIEMY